MSRAINRLIIIHVCIRFFNERCGRFTDTQSSSSDTQGIIVVAAGTLVVMICPRSCARMSQRNWGRLFFSSPFGFDEKSLCLKITSIGLFSIAGSVQLLSIIVICVPCRLRRRSINTVFLALLERHILRPIIYCLICHILFFQQIGLLVYQIKNGFPSYPDSLFQCALWSLDVFALFKIDFYLDTSTFIHPAHIIYEHFHFLFPSQ